MPRERVLIVDDNVANLKLARVVLEGEGYDVRTAGDAVEALALAREFSPKLVLADIQLPGMDGLELTRQLKADPATARIAVLALTAYAMKGDEEKALAAGCDGYITKPIDTRKLAEQVAAHIGQGKRPAVPPFPEAADARAVGRPGILVVEDNPITRKVVRVALESVGYEVREAEGGVSALNAIEERRPDLVLQDYVLPDLGGLELLSRIRAATADAPIPVLVLSGRVAEIEALKEKGGTFDGFLRKPIEPTRLVLAVRSHIEAANVAVVAELVGRRILVVDDEPFNLRLARVWLSHAGCAVQTAEHPVEAFETARRVPPDAILSDVLMPGMDGFELCRSVRLEPGLAAVPVVLVSASYVANEDHVLARRVGASALVTRTPDYGEAIEALRVALGAGAPIPGPPPEAATKDLYRDRLLDQLNRQLEEKERLSRRDVQQATTLSLLSGICEALAHPLEPQSVLSSVLVHCLDAMGLSVGLLYVLQPDGRLRLHAMSGLDQEASAALSRELDQSEEVRRILEAGQAEAVPAGAVPPSLARLTALLGKSALLVIPLIALGRLRGALVLASEPSLLADPSWISFSRTVSAHLGEAIALKETVARLNASERTYQTLFEGAAEGIFQSTPAGRFVVVNPALARSLGFDSPEELVDSVADIGAELYVVPSRQEELLRLLEEKGAVSGFEVEMRRKDGQPVWLRLNARALRDDSGEVVLLEGFAENVTGTRTAEEALLRNEERLERIVAASPAVIFTLRVGPGGAPSAAWIGPNVSVLTGWTSAEALEPGWWDAGVHPDDHSAAREAAATVIATGHALLEYRFRRRDGSYRWIRDEMRLLRDPEGRPAEVVGSWSDVTELRRLEEQFRQSQKMEAMGRLAGGVAHDFNNLLTIINGYAETLLADLPTDSPLAEDVRQIRQAGERAAALTRQLLAFSRKQLFRRRSLDLNSVVLEMRTMLVRLLGRSVELSCELGEDVPPILADQSQMEQVILNLAVNARDAMPEGGRLEIRTRGVSEDGGEARGGATHAQLTVADTGTGIDGPTMARLFEPFFTTKGPGKGTGLGLSTVYGIVHQSGGVVSASSEPGAGTTFTIVLPRTDRAPEEAESTPDGAQPSSSPGTLAR